MIGRVVLLFFILASVMALSIALKKLTIAGALLGGVLGLCVYAGAGFTGLALLGGFFALGVVVTAIKRSWKETSGLTKKGESKRITGQVFANGGVAGILGLLAFYFPQHARLLQAALAASLASAAADTVSSELGTVYGRNFYNILTLKKDTRGLDGVVSWEGTLLGVAASIVLALIYVLGFGFSPIFFWIVIAGTTGNLFDSVLGATLERAHRLNNNAVNFLNTLIAALVSAAFVELL